MHLPSILSLGLAGFTVAAPSALDKRESFNGVGQIRAQWREGDYADLGCLTNAGKWTVDETLCGNFTATPFPGSFIYSYSLETDSGPCYTYGASIVCDNGNTGYPTIFGLWPWPNAIPNTPSLRVGNYGLMATHGNNPPTIEEGPQSVHFVTYSEKGKWVWLTWKAL
ncbi:hypothetical protein QBC44DRAFT_366325 [Cladorrhinum sp. PSN332]|nr:hypothetical protein QBC44DRAFT_366325 [Cladorrhinum sp. PSN332]